MATRISDIVEKQAFDQVEKLQTDLTELLATFNKTANGAALLNKAIMDGASYSEKAKNTTKTTQALSEMEKMQRKIIDTQNKLNAAESLHGQILAEERVKLLEANQANKDFVKSKQVQAGSIEELRLKLKAAQQEYDRMAASERNAARGTEILTHIKKVDTELKALSAATGRYQMNVGNYASATHSLSQVLREMPAFTYSAQTGILGLSNNLPILYDNFAKVKKEAGSTGAALKIFGSSMLSMVNIFTIAIGLVTIFADDIINLFKGTEKMTEAQKKLNEEMATANKQVADTIAKAKVQLSIITDVTNSYKDREAAYNSLNNLYPDLLSNMSKEEALNGGIAKSYDGIIIAIEKTMRKKAQYSQLEAAFSGKVRLENEISRLTSPKEGAFVYYDEEYMKKLNRDLATANDRIQSINKSIQKQNELESSALGAGLYKSSAGVASQGTSTQTRTTSSIGKPSREVREKEAKEYIDDLNGLDREVQLMNEKTDKETIDRVLKRSEEIKRINAKYAKEELDLISENLEANQRMWDQADKERLDSQMKRLDTFREAVALAESILSNIGGIIADQANARAERELKELDRVTDAQLAALDKVSMSATQKEEEKKRIEIQSEARRKQIERDKITDLRKAARLQKAADIASIISGTSVAIIGALGNKPWTPANIALAAGVGVAGGIQLARAYAAPLPQYAKGRKGGKEEWAELNEKGVELIESKDGKLSIANDGKRGVTFLKQGDKVHTHEDFMKMVENRTTVTPQYTSTSSDMYQRKQLEAVYDLQKEIKGLNNTMMRKKDGWKIEGTFAHDIRVESIRM